MLFGAAILAAGLVAIASPFLTGAVVTTFIGISLMVGGVMEILAGLGRPPGGRAGPVAGGVLAAAAGGLVVAHPVLGAAVIGMLLIAFFLLDGVVRSALALQLRPLPGWGWQLFSGLVSLALGILLWRDWPLSGLWAIGVLIGIRLLLAGFGILLLAGAAASLDRMADDPAGGGIG